MSRKTILFFGESVSLAHVVRPLSLARSLDPNEYDIHFACDPRYRHLVGDPPGVEVHALTSASAEEFVDGAGRADFNLSEENLEHYLGQETTLIEELAPALVVSDFRPTVAVAAERTGTLHATLTNVYWSPYRQLSFDPVPPVKMPAGGRSASAAFNGLRERYGLPPVKGYCELITRADFTLYLEPEGLIETATLPEGHRFLGPLIWSPEIARPSWWESWDGNRPLLYVTLGSTGLASHLPKIVRGLCGLGANVVVATAGRSDLALEEAEGLFVADFLPGEDLARRADLVMCNGGSATAYQALSHGAPVIGLWSNLDQYLTSSIIEGAGAGVCVRAQDCDEAAIAGLASKVLQDESFRSNAEKLKALFDASDAHQRFAAFVGQVVA